MITIKPDSRSNEALAGIYARLYAEVVAWRNAARSVSASIAGTDVSTPEKFLTAQLDAVCNLVDRVQKLQSELAAVEKPLPPADVLKEFRCVRCGQLHKNIDAHSGVISRAGLIRSVAPLCKPCTVAVKIEQEFFDSHKHCPPTHPVWQKDPLARLTEWARTSRLTEWARAFEGYPIPGANFRQKARSLGFEIPACLGDALAAAGYSYQPSVDLFVHDLDQTVKQQAL